MSQHHPAVIEDPHATIYFVSDVHLGGGDAQAESVKESRLHALFDRVVAEHGSLYILGDLFDFWFEYETVMPKTAFGILSRLDGLARSGHPVSYLGGNHDFWINDFLAKRTAVRVLEDATLLRAQGRNACLYHGDGMGPGDRGYKAVKPVLRHPLSIRLFRWIHPDLGIPFALRTSGVSRHHRADRFVDVEGLYSTVAVPELQNGADAVLMGHFHIPTHWNRAEGEMLILGDWFEHFTCVRLRDGKFELLAWPLSD
jgi:UDP-2,3-diacylglucosamine hydrolase